jgi:hypothetical protein
MANLNRNEGKPGGLTPEAQRWERSRSIVASPLGRLLLGLCLLQFVLVGWLTLKSSQPPRAAAALHAVARSNSGGANPDPVFRGNPGPWGVLEFVRITIEPPDEFVPVDDRTF